MIDTARSRQGANFRLLQSRWAAIALALALALFGLVPQFLSRTLPDIAYLLYAAGRVLDGARLYVDILEINPPLIVWLNMPVVAAARALGASEILVYRMAVVGILAGSLLACRWVIAQTAEGQDPALRRFLLLLLVVALFVLPRLDWGEREHLTLALVMPYVLFTAARLQRVPAGRASAGWIGALAAVGIAVKPQFALLCLARESLVATRDPRRPTFEGGVIAAAGMAYLIAVAVAVPEYFALVRELGGAYHTYLHNSIAVTALLGDGAAAAIGAVVLAVALWRWRGADALRLTLVVAVGASYVAAVMQQKGWRYHFLPALSLAWVLLAVLGTLLRGGRQVWTQRLFVAIAGAGALTACLAALVGCLAQAARPLDSRYDADPSIGQLIPVLREQAPGRDVMVVSPNMASGFPLTTYAGTRWPLRFSNLWPVVAAYDSALQAHGAFRYRTEGAMTAEERRVLETVAEDFVRSRPPLVLVLRTAPDLPKWGMRRMDLLAFLRRDPRFDAQFAGYDSLGMVAQYVVYRDTTPGSAAVFALPAPLPEPAPGRGPNEIGLEPGAAALAVVFLLSLFTFYRRGAGRGPSADSGNSFRVRNAANA
jgi:hypothetical protein